MVAPQRSKPIDKQELCRKLTALLKKAYHSSPAKQEVPVLETLLFAACYEETDLESAQAMLKRLHAVYPDLNEARVSSIGELQQVFSADEYAPWRALRIKNVLQHAFDLNYSFELEALRRKTAELAGKQLDRIPGVSWFIRGWSLQHSLGSHVLPLDTRMLGVLAWLGFAEPQADPEQTSESLRSYIRKADAPLFCHLLKCLSIDPRRAKLFPPAAKEADCSASPDEGLHRLEVLLNRGPAAVPKPAPRPEPASSKTAAKGTKPEAAKVDTKPVAPERVETAKAPAKSAAAKGEPPKSESNKSESTKSESTKSGHSKPAKGDTVRPTAGKPVPSKPEPAKPEQVKSAAVKADSKKPEGAKPDPARDGSSRAGTVKPPIASDRKGNDSKKGTPPPKANQDKGSGDKGSGDKGSGDKGSGDKGSGDKGAEAKLAAGKSPAKGAAPAKPVAAKPPAKTVSKGVTPPPSKGVKTGKSKTAKPDGRPSGKKRT
jgi:endonuclease-3